MESGMEAMDQHHDNNSPPQEIQELKRRIKELEQRIEDKDEALRQCRKQEDKTTSQLDEERAQRAQATKKLYNYMEIMATRAQEDRDAMRRGEETHRNEQEKLRDGQAREMSLQQELSKASSQVQEKKHELEKSQEKEKQAKEKELWALGQKEDADKKTCEMDQELREALRQGKALQEERDKAMKQGVEALKQKDAALEQRDEAWRKLEPSSMVNFLVQCQRSLFSKLVSESDSFLMGSKPSTTEMKNRYKPKKLRLWSGFLEKQRAIFKKLHDIFPNELQVFTRLITVIDNGEWIEPVSSEKALEMWIYAYIQTAGRQIFSKLRSADKASTVCEIFGDIKVMHYPRNLDDKIQVVKKLPVSTESETSPGGIIIPEAATRSTEPQESVPDPAPPKDKLKVVDDHFKPDGLYICTKPGVGPGRNVLLFSYEVKHISAITWELFASLQPTDTFGQVKEGQPHVKGVNLMNGALMQAYDYMVKSVSSFGMLTTGESIVFLYIDWSGDAATLYYHVAIPARDIEKAPDNLEETAFYSAVGQYVIFALMAMEHCRDFDQQQRVRVRSGLEKGDLILPTNKRTASKRKRQDEDSEEVIVGKAARI
ncbi:hypothetical protein E4U44_006913 [Claviceps purpurea]|nr:hypothetical protein E4U44_006913 [Claviceps purpurea]